MGLFLVEHDRVLLALRSATRRWYPGVWDVVGGHVEPEESSLDALVRETREELGILIDEGSATTLGTLLDDDLELTVYASRRWTGWPSNCAPKEHEEVKWFSLDELRELDLAHPSLTHLAAAALEAGPAERPR